MRVCDNCRKQVELLKLKVVLPVIESSSAPERYAQDEYEFELCEECLGPINEEFKKIIRRLGDA